MDKFTFAVSTVGGNVYNVTLWDDDVATAIRRLNTLTEGSLFVLVKE